MKILGITGGSGTGKTTVSKLFAEKGFYIIDADIVAREIVEPGKPALSEIEAFFGKSVIKEDKTLDRKALAGIVFTDSEKLKRLNEITHKYITESIEEKLEKYSGEWAVIDAAVLLESGLGEKCDKILSVVADFDVRKKRIIARDSLSEKQATDRLNSQKGKEFYIENSDFVIENNADEYALKKAVDEIIKRLELE